MSDHDINVTAGTGQESSEAEKTVAATELTGPTESDEPAQSTPTDSAVDTTTAAQVT